MNNIPEEEQKIMVSIVCSTFNHVNYIAEAIESFLMQKTNFKYEIIVHDDASTDGTSEIIRSFALKFPEIIKPIIQSENVYSKGMKPWIICFEKCEGKYIALCEGDDYWTDPLKLQKQVDFLEKNPSFSMCFSNAIVVDKDGQYLKHKLPGIAKKNLSQEKILSDITPPSLTSIFRRDCYPFEVRKDLKKVFNGDLYIFSLITYHGDAAYLDIDTAAYRLHDNGTWSKLDKLKQQRRKIDTLKTYLYYGPNTNPKNLIDTINNLHNQYIDFIIEQGKILTIFPILAENFLFSAKHKNLFFIQIIKKIIINRSKIAKKLF